MIGPGLVGLAIGAVLGFVNYVVMRELATRVELPETARVLGLVAKVDLVLFPLVGYVIGAFFWV